MKLSQLGEFGLIEILKKLQHKRKETIVGIGDDCAVIKSSSTKYLLITTDSMIENVHFKLKNISFFDLGYRALFINISDIASMGGTPTHALVTIGVPKNTKVDSITQFYKGLNALAKKLKIDVVGGDTIASPKEFVISITLLGEVEKKNLITRRGAKVGDLILTTGDFGGPASIKYQITNASHRSASARGGKLQMRLKEARVIAKSKLATSLIDSSDGLIRSVLEVCKSSKVGALIYENEVPIARGATLNQALYGGEEYELVFTAPVTSIQRLRKLLGKIKVTIVGEMRPQRKGLKLLDIYGKIKKPKSGGYEHFK